MQKHILIVDDDEDIRDVLTEFFKSSNHKVTSLSVVENIFKALNTHNPDLILLDYRLPGDNGGEICHQLKSNPGTFHIPVLMISGYPRNLLERDYSGWDGIISKPFDLDELQVKVEKFLNK